MSDKYWSEVDERRALAAGWRLGCDGWMDAEKIWQTTWARAVEGAREWSGPAVWSDERAEWVPGTLSDALDAQGVPPLVEPEPQPAGATLRLTPAQLARLEAAGWVAGSGALEEWLVARAEDHQEIARYYVVAMAEVRRLMEAMSPEQLAAVGLRAAPEPVPAKTPEERARAAGWGRNNKGEWRGADQKWRVLFRYERFWTTGWRPANTEAEALTMALDADGVP